MTKSSLDIYIEQVKSDWGPLTTETVARCRRDLEALARAPATEAWLAALHGDPPEDKELYRDPDHGFLLMTHVESRGRYRVPHDHGRGWVIYAVQHGEVEMGSFGRIADPDGKVHLVKRETYRMRAGDCRVFLPGDIHDTHCLSASVLMYRFTSCDLKQEAQAGRMTRYVERDGSWTVGTV